MVIVRCGTSTPTHRISPSSQMTLGAAGGGALLKADARTTPWPSADDTSSSFLSARGIFAHPHATFFASLACKMRMYLPLASLGAAPVTPTVTARSAEPGATGGPAMPKTCSCAHEGGRVLVP